ncbi:AAA family ATPase [Pseudoduganella sp. FT26W]|uniref:AAA family ATPase n=1 Tax=Duganella aquatilis TaxID=2666082 RepID=A0A844DB63_9BURK|nr:AAA family ATPase [Duganella aquatilis]MRW87535.1 AAA family ATPase [Duganella aquatilis]
MSTRLSHLTIENFRSIRGKIDIPLDAQVVLIHGTNGMGKTSVLSAIELGLTGKIAHLAANGSGYQAYLSTLDSGGGTIELTTTAPPGGVGNTSGKLSFSDNSFIPTPVLDDKSARFFAERCYLPQATLGRLLEVYNAKNTGPASPLTLFVKELLGLDPLDALIDGLDHAFNVTRVRKLVPDFVSLEKTKTSLEEESGRTDLAIVEATKIANERLISLNEALQSSFITLDEAPTIVTAATDLVQLKSQLDSVRDTDRRLTDLSRTRSELRALQERWKALATAPSGQDQATKEKDDLLATEALATWQAGQGRTLGEAIQLARTHFSDLPSFEDAPEESRSEAQRRAQAEADRCERIISSHNVAIAQVADLNAVVQKASTRIDELNVSLSGAASDAKSLANSLAGLSAHIGDETCPVCSRNYAELSAGSLSAHVAAKIESLSNQAVQLQALAASRAEETTRLGTAQRALLSAVNKQLSSEDLEKITQRNTLMTGLVQTLSNLKETSAETMRLLSRAATARQAVITGRRRDQQLAQLFPEVETVINEILQVSHNSFQNIEDALAEASRVIDERVLQVERIASSRIRAGSELDMRIRDLAQIATLRSARSETVTRIKKLEDGLKEIDNTRTRSKKISEAASKVRSDIVTKVFNTSLNKAWRDLFMRLAPSEQFVPAFRLPASNNGKVEAILETLHRSGKASGSPGAMLSQGNLNTAALTLFLALHLSVPVRMPLLLLDDPVQSMDDVHIAQFAALLRSLSKGLNRQIVIAVHERALFEYLSLELSPAFPGDSLVTVEIGRDFDGKSAVTSHTFTFEDDHAIAA